MAETTKFAGSFKRIYDTFIRDRLPRKLCVFNDVPARDVRLFDRTYHLPNYKQELKEAIESHITEGDQVVLVGGGRGVSSVWIVRQGATLIGHEASSTMLAIAEETVEIQGVGDAIEFRHTLVGNDVDVYGSSEEATVIPPSELVTNDVLVMDCEGAEKSILEGLQDFPETVIVETHPEKGVTTGSITTLLEEYGYDVEKTVCDNTLSEKHIVVAELESEPT